MKHRISTIAVLILLSSLTPAQEKTSFLNLTAEEFYQKLHSEFNPVLIDVRTRDDFSKERIHGSVLAETRADLNSIADTMDGDSPLFLYCEYNQRSHTACSLLVEKGFRNVYNLEGGLIQWRFLEYEMDRKKLKSRGKTP